MGVECLHRWEPPVSALAAQTGKFRVLFRGLTGVVVMAGFRACFNP